MLRLSIFSSSLLCLKFVKNLGVCILWKTDYLEKKRYIYNDKYLTFFTFHSPNTIDLLKFAEIIFDVYFSLSRYFDLPQKDTCLRKGISIVFEMFKVFDMILNYRAMH